MNIKFCRHMTMLEVLIGMTLTAVLLTILTFFYQQITWLNAESDKQELESFRAKYLESRLSYVFPNILPPKKDGSSVFFVATDQNQALKQGSPSLVFTFDNGICLDKIFSNGVLGRLFVNNKDQLILAKWPAPVRWVEGQLPPMKKEVLMDNVARIDFRFFTPPEKDRSRLDKFNKEAQTNVNPVKKNDEISPPEQPLIATQNSDMTIEWNDKNKLPPLLWLDVYQKIDKDKDKKMTFVFPLIKSKEVILYDNQ